MKRKFTDLSIAEQSKSNTVKFFTDKKNGLTVCRLYDRWYNRYFTAKTHCLDVDKFSEKKGRAIAFNKARRKELMADISMTNREIECLNNQYKFYLNRLISRNELKKIYLAGVEDELRALMNNENMPVMPEPENEYNPAALDSVPEPDAPVGEFDSALEPDAPVGEKDNEKIPTLTQFSNLTEIV